MANPDLWTVVSTTLSHPLLWWFGSLIPTLVVFFGVSECLLTGHKVRLENRALFSIWAGCAAVFLGCLLVGYVSPLTTAVGLVGLSFWCVIFVKTLGYCHKMPDAVASVTWYLLNWGAGVLNGTSLIFLLLGLNFW